MPNVLCERCEINMCRVQCSKCNKSVCNSCRLQFNKQHICTPCNRRRITPVTVSSIYVNRSHPHWGPTIDLLFNEMYVLAGEPYGIKLNTAIITEYVARYVDLVHVFMITDRYCRIGDHYTCRRTIVDLHAHNPNVIREIPMSLSEVQKESIAAAAMHPKRLQYWLDQGWSEEWDKYFEG